MQIVTKPETPGTIGTTPGLDDASSLDDQQHAEIRCAACGIVVTTGKARTVVNGSHRHVFCNPAGLVFEIGCFQTAPGCTPAGPASQEFSWFPGSAWRIAVCRQCGVHLGWRFQGEGGIFYGLILDRLKET